MKKIVVLLCLLFPLTAMAEINIEYGSGDELRDITCSQPSSSEIKRFKQELRLFINKYKKTTLSRHLNKIVACKKLARSIYDWYRGTYVEDKNVMYVEVGGSLNDTEYILHHEFSSLLLYNNGTKRKALQRQWDQWSNKDYNLDHNKRDWAVKRDLQRDGFLYEYSKLSFENDFNVMAAFYMSNYLKYNLRVASNKHWRIKNKYKTLREFYRPLIK
jgi:hypothetical protein